MIWISECFYLRRQLCSLSLLPMGMCHLDLLKLKGTFALTLLISQWGSSEASLVCHVSDLLTEYLLQWEGQDHRSSGTCQFNCDVVWGKTAKLDKYFLVENALSSGKKNKYRGITANKNIMYFL